MTDPIRGQILLTDNLLTVTRPRQEVVHIIAETFDIKSTLTTDLRDNTDPSRKLSRKLSGLDFVAQNTGVLRRKKQTDCLS